MFFDLPSGAKVDKYMAGMPTTQWLTWTNPRNEYSNAIILAAGGGASGGAGNTTTGGGAGGAGGFGHIYCPLSLLPDTLYIQVGLGGLGSAGTGAAGATTYINLYPSTQTANNLITCTGGGRGQTGGTAGSGGAVTINNTLGVAQGYTGGGGTAGVTTGTATSSLPTTGSPIYGGGGGSFGGAGVGGGMTSVSSLYPSIAGATGTNVGDNGFVIQKPFTVFGGCGAGAGGGIGRNAGNGIMGSGGGGGGGASGGSIGTGGNGGDGFVIIICY
jgi:hypothetical protein